MVDEQAQGKQPTIIESKNIRQGHGQAAKVLKTGKQPKTPVTRNTSTESKLSKWLDNARLHNVCRL